MHFTYYYFLLLSFWLQRKILLFYYYSFLQGSFDDNDVTSVLRIDKSFNTQSAADERALSIGSHNLIITTLIHLRSTSFWTRGSIWNQYVIDTYIMTFYTIQRYDSLAASVHDQLEVQNLVELTGYRCFQTFLHKYINVYLHT